MISKWKNPLSVLIVSVLSASTYAASDNSTYIFNSSSLSTVNNLSSAENWWTPYDTNQGFNDALKELGLTYEYLQNNAEDIRMRATDSNDPLFWLKRTLSIYQDYNSANKRYNIPMTEVHANGRNRTTSAGRNGFFPTHTWVNSGDTLTIESGAFPSHVYCDIAVDSKLEDITGPEKTQHLTANGLSTYKATTSGLVLFACVDQTKALEHKDEQASITIKSGGYERDLFTFGLNTNSEWKEAANAAANSGFTAFFDGRTRYIVNNQNFKKSANTNILQTLRENLTMTVRYDILNGLQSGKGYLHEPSRGLEYVNYNSGFWSFDGQGQVGIGDHKYTIPSHSLWGEWHEYGHQYQMEWSWSGQEEVTEDLYALQNCYLSFGDVDISKCHSNSGLKGFTWDQQAVGNFLKSGQSQHYSSESNVFRRATMFGQLMTSWPNLFGELGQAYREADQAGANGSTLNSTQKKVDWFVTNTSRLSGYDLREFFSRWGLNFSTLADSAIAAMQLPAPLQPATSYAATLTKTGGNESAKVTLSIDGDSDRTNTAFVTNHGNENTMSLVWENDEDSYVKAIVVDSAHRSFIVKLLATNSHGDCPQLSYNSAKTCPSGTSSNLHISYRDQNNLSLPPGHYKGKVALIARDWYKKDWSANVNINLDITK